MEPNQNKKYSWRIVAVLLMAGVAFGQAIPPVRKSGVRAPHFEAVSGRQVFHADGAPSVVLAVEIPWWDVVYPRYRETMTAYDYLYPAARELGLNALKVPVKWSVVEPREGVYDFSYVDHAKAMAEKHGLKLVLCWFGHYASGDGTAYRNLSGELFVPLYVAEDVKRFPRAVDGEGMVHHNALSYEYDAVIERESVAFTRFMEHIKKVDSGTHTILMIQVENEIAVFGGFERQNKRFWRDHSPLAEKRFAEGGFQDDLRYSAWSLSSRWIRRISDAGYQAYPLPQFVNFVGGRLADWMVGGAAGEDVATYLENCPAITFAGLNYYDSAGKATADGIRGRLRDYQVGRNLPSITETNSDRTPTGPRVAFLAVGEFGAPLFAPWALSTSYPGEYQPYVLPDGKLANGAFALREALTSLRAVLAPLAVHGGTERVGVFLADEPGTRFEKARRMAELDLTVTGSENGQLVVIQTGARELLLSGYRTRVSFPLPDPSWEGIRKFSIEAGRYEGIAWRVEGAPRYTINQTTRRVGISFNEPQALRLRW